MEEILSKKNMLTEECVMFILNVNAKFFKTLEAINLIIFWQIVPGVLTCADSSNDDHGHNAEQYQQAQRPLGLPPWWSQPLSL